MKQVVIKAIATTDLKQIQTIGKQTFLETFADTNTTEDMEQYLNKNFSVKQLTKELNNPHSAFYCATINDCAVGYLKVNWSHAQTEKQDKQALEIERIYVLKIFHGNKVGQLLYDKAFEIAQQKESKFLWLGVWEHNPRAIRFYEKNGFVAFDKHIFTVGTDKQTDILMKLML